MADSKLTGLTANTTPALTDLLYIVDDPGGTPLSQKITVGDLLGIAGFGAGTIGKIPKWTGAGALGDSILSEAGSILSAAGSFAAVGAANTLTMAGSTTGNPVTLTASGSDAKVPLVISPKTSTANTAPTVFGEYNSAVANFEANQGRYPYYFTGPVQRGATIQFGVQATPAIAGFNFGGSYASPTASTIGLMNIAGIGYDGTDPTFATGVYYPAAIEFAVSGAISPGVIPTDIHFLTAASGDVNYADPPMILRSSGLLYLKSLTTSQLVATDASKNLVSLATTGSGSVVLATGPTIVAPLTLTGVVGSSALTINGATQTASFPVISATQTWNNAGVTFKGIVANFTNTASAAGSLLVDLQLGGTSLYKFGRNSALTIANAGGDSGLYNPGSIVLNTNAVGQVFGVSEAFVSSGTAVRVGALGSFSWQSTNRVDSGSADVVLWRDVAGIIAKRNAANAQADRTYNTWTNASNGEWLEIGYKDTTNVATIKSKANGTGTVRDLALDPGTADLQIVKALVALGGGAAPTLGTIGGSGPATAAQNTWMRFKDSTGAACFVPVWK